MKKAIIFACLILSGIIILDSLHAGHAIMMFLLAGVIPGTNVALSASTTMELFALLLGLVVGRLSSRALRLLTSRLPQLSHA